MEKYPPLRIKKKKRTKHSKMLNLSHSLLFFSTEDLELLVDRVSDLIEFRIDAVLEEMSSTPLCQLPQEAPLTCEEFLQMTKVIRTLMFL